MSIRTVALAGVLGAVILCCDCAATDISGIRRSAETRLMWCLNRAGNDQIAREVCKQESFAYCLQNMPLYHIEKGCGLGAH